MPTHKLTLKLFLKPGAKVSDEEIVPLFHGWIQSRALPEHLLIDVADYAHVHHGPGVVLVSHEANIYLDHQSGRPGLVYQRKQPFPNAQTLPEKLREALRHALTAARQLQASTGNAASFDLAEISIKLADRLAAPNTAETFDTLKPDVQSVATDLLGPAAKVEHRGSPSELLEIVLTSSAGASVESALAKIGTPQAVS